VSTSAQVNKTTQAWIRMTAQNTETVSLMRTIRDRFRAQMRAASAGTPIPESFFAALTANESGGDVNASRYEAYELAQFALVLCGKRDSYQGITASQLTSRLAGVLSISSGVRQLVDLCTSWGPTQIMGWHAIRLGVQLSAIQKIESHYSYTSYELLQFTKQFYPELMVQAAMHEDQREGICIGLFHCWNSGKPSNPTTDPLYASRGLARMKAYEALP